MKVEVHLVPEREVPTLVIEAPSLTGEVEALAARLRELDGGSVPGWRGERAYLLDPAELTRLYAQDKGVFAQDGAGEVYDLRLRLYELEGRLDRHQFVRISHSEIVNLRKVTALDLSLGGTIKMTLAGGTVCWVSRRYVKKIKQALEL